jgi:hypothetical protein
MRSRAVIAFGALTATCLLTQPVPAARKFEPVDPARIQYWASLLPATPQGVGRPIGDRQAWELLARAPAFRSAVRAAEQVADKPIPELADEAYVDFSRTGNRTRGQAAQGRHYAPLPTLVLGECLEARGRFLPAIERAFRAVLADKTWVMPAHDGRLTNFNGTTMEIDLRSSAVSWDLATAAYWLGDRLSLELRRLIRAELERRTFAPYRAAVCQNKAPSWWLYTTSNWNAVCLAGVTGAALGAIESRADRALFAAAAEKYVQNFLSGFTPDGYCSEGLGYWNYGFGNFVVLAETVRQASGERVDWMHDAHVREAALFARHIEILPGVCPAFADCGVGPRADRCTMALLSRIYGWGLMEEERTGLGPACGRRSLAEIGVLAFPNSATKRPAATQTEASLSLRAWFSDAGILICRPGRDGVLGAALKGGHNAEHHNHNDVGSFVIALGRATPLLDPGGEVYTARTFSRHRYDSNALNSFGHPVPRVAGQLQRTGREAQAKILEAKFSDACDRLALDLRSAYTVPSLKKLERTFVFSRSGRGSLSVSDEVVFSRPETFGTALVTFAQWRQVVPGRLRVGEGAEAVDVQIDAGGLEFKLQAEEIREDMHGHKTPTRLGIELAKPVAQARVTVTIKPAE